MNALDDREGLADHLPPHNLEAERGVIAAAMLEPATLNETASVVSAGDFYREAHAVAWQAILGLYDRGQAVDAIGLADELARRGQYKAIGGDQALLEIVNSVPHAANALYHAQIVRQKATARQLIQACTDVIRDAYSNLHTAAELVASAEAKVFAISEAEATGATVDAGEVIADSFQAIDGRKEGRSTGLMSGFGDLDYLTDGFKPGDLVILAARPSQGKTAMAMAIAQHVAEAAPGSVLFVSLEMSRGQLGERLLSSWANLGGDKLKRPWTMTDAERGRLGDAAAELRTLRLKIDDTPARTLSQIGANARRVKSRGGLSLVVVDYLGLIDGQRQKGENRQEEVARISRRLKSLARELAVPVLCLHQLNRQSETREDRRPRLADLRESGQIEQDADSVILIHRPEFYNPNDQPGIAEVYVAKNRNGPTGQVRLAFVGHCTRFDSLTPFNPEETHGTAY